MGYEVNLFVGEVSSIESLNEKGLKYFRPILTIDLCKTGDSEIGVLSGINATTKGAEEDGLEHVYLFGLDGSIKFTEDKYGKRLTAIPLDDVLEALDADANNDDYWRFKLALKTLTDLKKTAGAKRAKGFKVVLWGY